MYATLLFQVPLQCRRETQALSSLHYGFISLFMSRLGPVTLILLDASTKRTDRVKGEGKWQSNVKGTQTAHPNLHTNAFVNKVRMSPPDFNVNIPETLDKMTDSLLFWAFMVSCFIYMIWLSELHEAPYVRECC